MADLRHCHHQKAPAQAVSSPACWMVPRNKPPQPHTERCGLWISPAVGAGTDLLPKEPSHHDGKVPQVGAGPDSEPRVPCPPLPPPPLVYLRPPHLCDGVMQLPRGAYRGVMMAVKLFELGMAGAVVVLLALAMLLLITELLGNSPWEEAGEGRGGRGK